MKPKVAIVIFPGSNSEEETLRACDAAAIDAELVHWSRAHDLPRYGAFVLPGGFAYEDRLRAGAIAAHDRLMDHVIAAAQREQLVLGICNGAQILCEAGLVPGSGEVRRPQAAFTHNAPRARFMCRRVDVKLTIAPQRCALTAGLEAGESLPMWAAHGEGRLAAAPEALSELERTQSVAFRYADAAGNVAREAPNGSALAAAGLTNGQGNVLAIMPHPERDGWVFQHRDGKTRQNARGDRAAMLAPSGGARLFSSFARALRAA